MYVSAKDMPEEPTARLTLDSPQMSYDLISQHMG